MSRIEKTIFISYRRTDVYTALAVYENLKNHGYDIFFDYRSIASGDFEQVISSNIRARAHFLLILTPTALDRCNEPGDWLRREIELAIEEKRNIVPLFFKGFRFGGASKSGISKWLPLGKQDVLTGKLGNLPRYNGLNVHEDYFEEAMNRLRTEYLNKPLDTVLHPVSTEVQKVVEEEKQAADQALKHKEDIKEPVKLIKEKPAVKKDLPKPVHSKLEQKKIESPITGTRLPWNNVGSMAGLLVLITLCIWGGGVIYRNLSTAIGNPTQTVETDKTNAAFPTEEEAIITPTNSIAPTSPKTITPSLTPTLDVGSIMIGEDGMTLLYIPAGEFTMGSEQEKSLNECQNLNNTCYDSSFVRAAPSHLVHLDSYWIDETEVTNQMYFICVQANVCKEPVSTNSSTFTSYFGNPDFDNYPVINVNWYMAKTYCEWVDRRLPTEAEWEKAARGVDANIYPWGNTFDGSLANFSNNNELIEDNYEDVSPVGSFPLGKSPYGALDMLGNVYEWVADWYSETYYTISPDINPEGPDSGSERVLRDNSWADVPNFISVARYGTDPEYAGVFVGFRCAMDAE